MLMPATEGVYAGGYADAQQGEGRQGRDVGQFLVRPVVPALPDDVDPQYGEDGKSQPVVPFRYVAVYGSREEEAQHGHQELAAPGGQGYFHAVAEPVFLDDQAEGEGYYKGVHG